MSSEQRQGSDVRRAVHAYYDALDADDIEAVLDGFSGQVLYRRGGYPPIVGIEKLREYYASGRKILAGRHVLRSVLVEGLSAAAHGEYEGDLKGGGHTSVGFAAFFTFDGTGRITEHTTYFFVPAV